MLVIKPIPDKDEQKQLTERCGIVFDPTMFAYRADDNDRFLAAAQFDILGESAVIDGMAQVDGRDDDREAMFILGRAVLNFLDLSGVKTVDYTVRTPQDEMLAKMIGFHFLEGKYTISLSDLFASPCSHGNGYQND